MSNECGAAAAATAAAAAVATVAVAAMRLFIFDLTILDLIKSKMVDTYFQYQ